MPTIWTPAPIAVTHPSLFTKSELEAFERHIFSNKNACETDASHFFASIPKFLYLGQGDQIRREVVLVRSGTKTTQRVDFFRRAYRSRYWDVIEIKDPHKPFVVSAKSHHPRLSADVDKAINQAQDYRDLIDRDEFLRMELAKHNISVWKPQIVVIVGTHDGNLPPDVMESLLDRVRHRGPIDAWSYDDIYQFAKNHYASNQLILVVNHGIIGTRVDPGLRELLKKRRELQDYVDDFKRDASPSDYLSNNASYATYLQSTAELREIDEKIRTRR